MGDTKGMNAQVIKDEAGAGLEFKPLIQRIYSCFRRPVGRDIGVYWQVAPSGQNTDSVDMISVLMSYYDGGQVVYGTIDKPQPAADFLT